MPEPFFLGQQYHLYIYSYTFLCMVFTTACYTYLVCIWQLESRIYGSIVIKCDGSLTLALKWT